MVLEDEVPFEAAAAARALLSKKLAMFCLLCECTLYWSAGFLSTLLYNKSRVAQVTLEYAKTT